LITAGVSVQGEVLALPFSNPGLPKSCWAALELMVKLMVVVWVSDPEVPVTAMVLVPVVAVALAVNVRTLVDVVGLVPNAAVTPLGRAELESVTDPVKPPEGVTVTVLLPLVPWVTVRLAGDAESEKFGVAVAFTVRLTVVVCVSVPDVPVMVTEEVPVAAVALAVNVTLLLDVVGLVPKLAVTPEGRPDADKLTLPVKPPEGLTVIVLLPLLPCVTVTLAGDAERVKFGVAVAFTVRLTVVVCVSVPDVPVIVTVEVPVVAVALAVSVNELVPVVLTGLNEAVTPLGRPDADKLTLPVKPPEGLTVIVLLPLLPCVTVTVVGEAESEKLGVAVAGKLTQLLAELENSNWTVYVVPLAVYEPCWPLQMSPISPFVGSYQARGGPMTVAMPTCASVIASVNS